MAAAIAQKIRWWRRRSVRWRSLLTVTWLQNVSQSKCGDSCCRWKEARTHSGWWVEMVSIDLFLFLRTSLEGKNSQMASTCGVEATLLTSWIKNDFVSKLNHFRLLAKCVFFSSSPNPVPARLPLRASNHGISLDEIPIERRQKFLDRQKRTKKWCQRTIYWLTWFLWNLWKHTRLHGVPAMHAQNARTHQDNKPTYLKTGLCFESL